MSTFSLEYGACFISVLPRPLFGYPMVVECCWECRNGWERGHVPPTKRESGAVLRTNIPPKSVVDRP